MIIKNYNKQELLEKIDSISIIREGNTIITKIGDRVTKTATVSDRYEVFDIKNYIKSRIDMIEQNFTIDKYRLKLTGGIQELTLYSDVIELNGHEFQKTFHIINSTDKTRRLQFNTGLYSRKGNFYTVFSKKNVSLSKKHLRGVTEAADMVSDNINDENFTDQIEAMKKLIDHTIRFSKLREVIVGDGESLADHKNFDKLKYDIKFTQRGKLDQKAYSLLSKKSENIKTVEPNEDIVLDAFAVFQTYMRIFAKMDSSVIKRETEKVLKITQWAVRREKLKSILY